MPVTKLAMSAIRAFPKSDALFLVRSDTVNRFVKNKVANFLHMFFG